jgi:SAM-dependent methyltransferase
LSNVYSRIFTGDYGGGSVLIDPCKVCGNREFNHLFNGRDRIHYLPGEFKLFRCRVCGLILLHPQLGEEELKKYYPEDYYSYKNLQRITLPRSKKDKIVYYLTHPVQALNCIFYSKLLGLNKDLPSGPMTSILDIGCGDGRYLLEKRGSGCTCFGNDISEAALMRLKKAAPEIDVRCGNLWHVGYPEKFFDMINLSNVLEHVTEVHKLLAEARRIAKDNGLLRIQVPNAASVTFLIFKKYWMPLEVPRHVYVFSLKNLKRLFESSGFEVVNSRTIEGPFSVTASIFFVIAAALRKKIELMRYEHLWDSELLKLLLFPYVLLVNLLRLGAMAEFILRTKVY